MQLEDRGALRFRPRYCELFQRLFLPIRPSLQKTCSNKCGHLLRYQRYVAKLKTEGEKAFQEAIHEDGPGGR